MLDDISLLSCRIETLWQHDENGRLDIAPDPEHPGSPALPLPVAQLLAHTCGSLLYTLELTAFIEGQSRRLESQVAVHLTKREREVLELICRGCSQQAIATQLHIALATVDTHRKRICEKLGVHSERDIPLAAYRANLFSILDKPGTVSSALPIGEE
jgi:DNA-binding CsgD family transcriptional regulator